MFDYEKQYTYKDSLGQTHIEYYPMRYINSINTSKPQIDNSTWINYGTEGSSKADTNNCLTEKTNGEILNSGSHMSGQVSCEPHDYNAGNYYNYPAATLGNSELNSVCARGWRLPENNSATSYSNLFINYGVDFNVTMTAKTYDAALLNLPLSFLRSGLYYSNGILGDQGNRGFYRMSSLSLYFHSGGLNPTYNTLADRGYSVRCMGR